MMINFREKFLNHLKNYCLTRSTTSNQQIGGPYIGYGTAGFRGNAALIERLFYKVGLISALRCLKLNANIGIMITASHNPIQDNGVKLIDASGEMLASEWELIVEKYCNIDDSNQHELSTQFDSIITQQQIQVTRKSSGRVYIAYDNRPSSETLVRLVKQGLDSLSELVEYTDYGLLSTPSLHFLVAESNKLNMPIISVDEYYQRLLINGLVNIYSREKSPACNNYSASDLVVDCANGVGYETMKILQSNESFTTCLPFQLINTGDGVLNHLCGADYVKTNHLPPGGANLPGKRYASLDGDADRLVYFYLDKGDDSGPNHETGEFTLRLLDGDKIMALYALHMRDLLSKSQLDDKLSFAIIQTAYANGASTDFMSKELNLKVEFADTGVKNLHKLAKNYDVAIYFEANGHGTIWLSTRARTLISTGGDGDGLAQLQALVSILNNYTGDAISDILIVETILRHYDWSVEKWYHLYTDRPSSLTKVEIADRNCIKTTNAGRTCTEPANLQIEIDNILEGYESGSRCFVRASGTENVVRIYAEAPCQERANELAVRVGQKVRAFCNSECGASN